jgi:hypothetical protein
MEGKKYKIRKKKMGSVKKKKKVKENEAKE